MAMILVTLIVTFHKLNIKEISLSQRKNVFFLSLLFNTDVHLASSNAHFVIYSEHISTGKDLIFHVKLLVFIGQAV